MGEPLIDEDALVAAVDLVGRSGAKQFEAGYLDDDVPSHLARWWASARYKGARLQVDEHQGPVEAAEALARKILDGGRCTHCGGITVVGDHQVITTSKTRRICRWTRTGARWDRSCAPPVNRADRRRRDRAARKGRRG